MKALFSTLGALVIVVVAIGIIAGFVLWSKLPDTIAEHLSNNLRVPCSIGRFEAGWSRLGVSDIRISNLPKSILNTAFSCKQLNVLAPLPHYLQKQIVIDEINLNSVYLGLEFDSATSTKGNWSILMQNLSKATTTSEPSSHSVLIHKLVITDLDVDVVYRKDGSKIHRLPRIPRMELTDISSEGGFPMDQLMNSVLGEMLKEVFIKQNLNNMLQELLKQTKPVQEYLGPIQKFFNTKQVPSKQLSV